MSTVSYDELWHPISVLKVTLGLDRTVIVLSAIVKKHVPNNKNSCDVTRRLLKMVARSRQSELFHVIGSSTARQRTVPYGAARCRTTSDFV